MRTDMCQFGYICWQFSYLFNCNLEKEFENENKESGGGVAATVAPLSDKANVFQQFFNKVSARFFAYEERLILAI